jgi:hypothetical protein
MRGGALHALPLWLAGVTPRPIVLREKNHSHLVIQ